MRSTLKFTTRLVLPDGNGKTIPVEMHMLVNTDKPCSMHMKFLPGSEGETIWCSSVSLLMDAFAGASTPDKGDIVFCVDAKSQEVRLLLTSYEGTAELILPYLPLLQLMDQLHASGFKPWQLPEVTDEEIAQLLQEAE